MLSPILGTTFRIIKDRLITARKLQKKNPPQTSLFFIVSYNRYFLSLSPDVSSAGGFFFDR